MKFSAPLLLVSLAFAASAIAQQKSDDHASHHPAPTTAVAAAPLTDGEVRKVDKEGRRLTLRHGEIKNLAMPPMTMVFRVTEVASLEALAPGDKVRFKAVLEGGTLIATDIQAVR